VLVDGATEVVLVDGTTEEVLFDGATGELLVDGEVADRAAGVVEDEAEAAVPAAAVVRVPPLGVLATVPPSAAPAPLEIVAARCALAIADEYAPTPCGPPLLFEELGFSASVHTAKTATVATSSPISGRETLLIPHCSAANVVNLSHGAVSRRGDVQASRRPSSRS
jgi:hypothetical protein